jgi:hypothetical protein
MTTEDASEKTFRELGFDLPLYEAPAESARGFLGPGTCSLCQTVHPVTFDLGVIGADLVVACGACGVDTALDADDAAAAPCRASVACGAVCLRAGRAAGEHGRLFGPCPWR